MRPLEKTYQALKNRLTSGELPTGTRLPSLLEMAVAYGVSRSTLWKVISRLQIGPRSMEPVMGEAFLNGSEPLPVTRAIDNADACGRHRSRFWQQQYPERKSIAPEERTRYITNIITRLSNYNTACGRKVYA